MDTELQDDLVVWSETDWILEGVQLSCPIPDVFLFTDSSSEGWDATLSGLDVAEVWRGSNCFLDINHQELLAVKLALQHFLGEIQSKTELHCSSISSEGGGMLPATWLHRFGLQQPRSTIGSGTLSLLGVWKGVSILSIPL